MRAKFKAFHVSFFACVLHAIVSCVPDSLLLLARAMIVCLFRYTRNIP